MPGNPSASPARHFSIYLIAVTGVVAIVMAVNLAAGFSSGILRITRIAFPSSVGSSTLVRTRVRILNGLHFESWSQPSGLSYSLWFPFESNSPSGDALQCRVEMEGWLRTRTLHRSLLDLSCLCERPHLHHDRETNCPGMP